MISGMILIPRCNDCNAPLRFGRVNRNSGLTITIPVTTAADAGKCAGARRPEEKQAARSYHPQRIAGRQACGAGWLAGCADVAVMTGSLRRMRSFEGIAIGGIVPDRTERPGFRVHDRR